MYMHVCGVQVCVSSLRVGVCMYVRACVTVQVVTCMRMSIFVCVPTRVSVRECV